jgi:hypothetical protein
MDKPKALRLANELGGVSDALADEAAAELRRLVAENERLHQINQSHEMKLSVRGYEIQIADLKAVNQELLEALKHAHTWLQGSEPGRAQYLGEVIKAEEQK